MRVFLDHYEHHLLDRTVLYPGVREILDYFRGKRRVVVSNKIHRLAVAVLRGLGVRRAIRCDLGRRQRRGEKTASGAAAVWFCGDFKFIPASALMVGDGDTDIEAGKRAGVITCGVTYGLGNKDDSDARANPIF